MTKFACTNPDLSSSVFQKRSHKSAAEFQNAGINIDLTFNCSSSGAECECDPKDRPSLERRGKKKFVFRGQKATCGGGDIAFHLRGKTETEESQMMTLTFKMAFRNFQRQDAYF